MLNRVGIICLLICFILTGCVGETSIDESSENYPPIDPTPSEEYTELTVYFPDKDLKFLGQEIRLVKAKEVGLEETLIEELLNGPDNSQYVSLIPKGTKLLSIDVVKGTAYVSFSKELIEKNYSEREEALTLYSIVNSLAALDSVFKVQILINGEIRDVFYNHYSLANSLNASSIIVNKSYVSPIIILDEYYESLKNRDFSTTINSFSPDKRDDFRRGIFTQFFQEIYGNVDDVRINDYVISEYNNKIEVLVKVSLLYGDSLDRKKVQSYVLVFNNRKFRIFEIGEESEDIDIFK